MRKLHPVVPAIFLLAMGAAGCTENRVVRGAAIGAAGGAVAGAVVPGISTVEGAAIGAAGGAIVGALTKDGKQWYRDADGREYWVDDEGRRHYRQ